MEARSSTAGGKCLLKQWHGTMCNSTESVMKSRLFTEQGERRPMTSQVSVSVAA